MTNSNNPENRMNLEMIARITSEDGTIIEKAVCLENAIPNVKDFDTSTKEGFLQDFDCLESSIIRARNQLEGQIAAAYMEETTKKNTLKQKQQPHDTPKLNRK